MWDAATVLERLQFWHGYERELTTLGLFAVGIAVYALLVYSLLAFISRRDPFQSAQPRKGGGWTFLRALRWLFLFPVIGFAYFLMISVSLFLLAKNPNQTVGGILLISVSLVAGIRIASWLSEPVAQEIAKVVPLGLLGVLLVDPGYLSLEVTRARFQALPDHLPVLGRYLLALFLLELAAKPILAMWRAREARKDTRQVPVFAGSANTRLFPRKPRAP